VNADALALAAARPALREAIAAFSADVRHYLTQQPRQLPSRYLYDALGSALFDAICELPWYPITRAEMRLLREHARTLLGDPAPATRVVELGAGNGSKLATLLGAGLPEGQRVSVHLVDVSAAALRTAASAVAGCAGVDVATHESSYEDGLDTLQRQGGSGRTLLLFLGSNIGNFDPVGAEQFLRRIRAALRPGDDLLLGADLVKPEAQLLLAYDDPLQVTAAFNRNLLLRINRELDANFDLEQFRHLAVWNADASRIEMHLVSNRRQRVRIARAPLELTLGEGERIWTESSYKYGPREVLRLLWHCGFRQCQQWIDEAGRFALTRAAA
jgi:L-histidine N-alpha-methyltransferase